MISAWSRFWFKPSPPTDLGVSRVVFFAGVFAMYAAEDFRLWGTVSGAFWLPLPLFTVLHLRPLSPDTLGALQVLWRVALVASAVGLFTRTSMTIAAVLGMYLLGLPHNFGQTYHFDALLVIVLGVLACSRAGDACSIDAWRNSRGRPQPSGEYTWPIRAVWVAMSLVFFAAGLAKLRYGGLAWITSSNMSILLTRALYHVSDADPLTRVGLWIAGHHWLASALAASAVITEVALVSRRARLILVPAAIAMLIAIRVMMGPTFGGFLVANVFWVPWQAILSRVEMWIVRRRPARQATSVDDRSTPLNVSVDLGADSAHAATTASSLTFAPPSQPHSGDRR